MFCGAVKDWGNFILIGFAIFPLTLNPLPHDQAVSELMSLFGYGLRGHARQRDFRLLTYPFSDDIRCNMEPAKTPFGGLIICVKLPFNRETE